MICVKVIKATGEKIDEPQNIEPSDVPHKPVAWVPVIDEEKPSYDPDSQVCEKTEGYSNGQWVRGWAVRSMTAGEQTAFTNGKISATDGGMIRAIEDLVALIATGTPLNRNNIPQSVIDKVNARRNLRGMGPV